MNSNFSIAIHGGAGTLIKGKMTPEKEKAYRQTLQLALDEGFAILKKNGSALDAVEKAVIVMEDSPLIQCRERKCIYCQAELMKWMRLLWREKTWKPVR